MGNTQSQMQNSGGQEVIIRHPKVERAIFNKNQGNGTLTVQYSVMNEDYENWKKNVESSPAKNSQFSLLPLHQEFKKGGMCGNMGTVQVTYSLVQIKYENNRFILSEEIEKRTSEGIAKLFTQPELWYIMYGIMDVASKFHVKYQKSGDIRPNNIFLSEKGVFKVAHKHSWPAETSAYEKFLYEKQKTFLAPEEVADIQVGKSHFQGDLRIAESFSLGLTILSLAVLEKGENVYEGQNFSSEVLTKYQQKLKKNEKYSNLLKFTILALTALLPENRLTCQKLKNMLENNRQKIIEFVPFEVTEVPDSIQRFSKNEIKYEYQKSLISKLHSELPIPILNAQQDDYNKNNEILAHSKKLWEDIDQKIKKSQEMFPDDM